MSTRQNIRAASVQFEHKSGDKASNLDKVRRFTAQAADCGVQLIVFPECCITGYWFLRNLSRAQLLEIAEPVPDGPSSQELKALSARHDITIGAGLVEVTEDGDLFNSYVIAMPSGECHRHRKLHCFVSEHMKSGSEYTVFDTPYNCKMGVLICYDNNIGENARMTALNGAEVLLAPHQTGGCLSPSPHCMGLVDPALWDRRKDDPKAIEAQFRGPKGRQWLMTWLPARAHDNGMFLIFSNGVGMDDNEVRTGNAMILDPYGRVICETWQADDEMIVADLDMSLRDNCTGVRWIKSRRPELYGMLAAPTGKEQDTRKVRFEGITTTDHD